MVSMFSTPAIAQGPVILGMTEAATQNCDGLTVQGIKLNYTGTFCMFNYGNGGTLTYTNDPTLVGTVEGTLTMTFSAPTTYLQFGVVYETLVTGTVRVQLYDPAGILLDTILVTTNPLVSYTEGLFVSNQADRLIGKAVITFPNSAGGSEFAVDNVMTTPFENFLYFFH